MQGVGTNLVEGCRCLKIGSLLEILILTRLENICIEDRAEPGSIIEHLRQEMQGTVIFLVEV